jgi:hypothetical protein
MVDFFQLKGVGVLFIIYPNPDYHELEQYKNGIVIAKEIC